MPQQQSVTTTYFLFSALKRVLENCLRLLRVQPIPILIHAGFELVNVFYDSAAAAVEALSITYRDYFESLS
ncbi:hypothetical protein HBI25_058690 [Parastagonospora nodorum]|nr:hypothetical protein HBI04_081420 [Parastagonospora nodorum]KAH5339764.1 hypothetical protein HBI12_002950 [Parastagonospora nodorum]KAH5384586.1 hypothetical protein HBI33_101920 [Parastagonospora nodorum]KAH5567198.1 hypothetical protein HBI25_058690 [Parastagonospora nodorum]